MMQTLVYDGSFDGWLSAVFDVYAYGFADAVICRKEHCQGNIFNALHDVQTNGTHAQRVWKGLEGRLSEEALGALFRCFHADAAGTENLMLSFVRYVFNSTVSVEKDYGNAAVLGVFQTAKKVWREKHRMEAFVRFQKTADGMYYALVEPGYNVLPLIATHFQQRYADQQWIIYDKKRGYGIFYNGDVVEEVRIDFDPAVAQGKDISPVTDEGEAAYQLLWQQYFRSVNIAARKNTKLHLQHMPRRYWKYMVEKKPSS